MAGMRTSRVLAVACLLWGLSQSGALKPGHIWQSIDPDLAPPTVEGGEGEALRPGYHLIAEAGWMNDPNGMFELNNITHVFYQWNPVANSWGSPYWGHVVSSDLVFWKRLPPALVPDTAYDSDGCFSGSAAFQADGTPLLLYTGVSQFQDLGYYYQVQASASPANASDPELVRWVKSPANPLPFELPPGSNHAEFRDPITPVRQDGRYWTGIGGQVDCVGSAILYSSADLQNWQLEGDLATQVGLGQTDGECPLPRTPTTGDGNCDQMGAECRAWECPDFYQLEAGVYVFKYSDQVIGRDPFAADWYVLSSLEPDLAAASVPANATDNRDVFVNAVAGSPSEARRIDYGSIYASKSWQASDGRRLWMGWAFETAVGCTQQCSTGSSFTATLGWQGVQTIPRVVTYDNASASLLFNPVEEIANLRSATLFDDSVDLGAHPTPQTATAILESSVALVQSELVVAFSLPALTESGKAPFTVGVTLSFGNDTGVIIGINGTIKGSFVTQANVFIDRSNAGGITNTSSEGGPMPLPPPGVPATDLRLHMLLDRSLSEIFALGGRGRVASRVYPAGMLHPEWSLSVFGGLGSLDLARTVNATVQLWSMSACWVESISA